MDYTRIHRLFRLITQIQGSPGMNAKRLAELCETCERTIYRDLDVLGKSGIPVSFDPDSHGYSIRRDFFLQPVDLKLEEAMALLMLAKEVGALEQIPHSIHAGKAAEKLLAILPRRVGEIINEVLPRTKVALAKTANEPTGDVYSTVRNAVVQRRAIECRYESSSGKAENSSVFRFDPYALYFGQRAWYVVGHHHGHDEIRTLKLARFTQCIPSQTPYLIPDEFSLDRHFGEAWRMMPSGKLYNIKLHFDAAFAENVADTHWHDSQQIEWLEDGSIEASFRVDGLEEIVWWILGYGPHCRVIAPKELAKRVEKLQKSAADNYATDI